MIALRQDSVKRHVNSFSVRETLVVAGSPVRKREEGEAEEIEMAAKKAKLSSSSDDSSSSSGSSSSSSGSDADTDGRPSRRYDFYAAAHGGGFFKSLMWAPKFGS